MSVPESDIAFLCVDCSYFTLDEYYMVNHDVWKLTGLGPHGGMLCIDCLEKRIGRRLRPDDFLPCPLNVMNLQDGGFHTVASKRLLSRMRGVD